MSFIAKYDIIRLNNMTEKHKINKREKKTGNSSFN